MDTMILSLLKAVRPYHVADLKFASPSLGSKLRFPCLSKRRKEKAGLSRILLYVLCCITYGTAFEPLDYTTLLHLYPLLLRKPSETVEPQAVDHDPT